MGNLRYDIQDKAEEGVILIGTVIGLAVSISMITLGAIHLDKCPAERYIPIFLVVSGSFSIPVVLIGMFLLYIMLRKVDIPSRRQAVLKAILGVCSLFLTAWFIAGNVWIYRLHNKYSPDPAAPNYCDNTLYLYAFWLTTTMYILIGILLIGFGVCIWMFFCCMNPNKS